MSLVEHLEKLRHFNSITKYKSINETAQSIGISQAGLSKSISNLETILGVSLFVRSKDGLTLTKEGELLLASTKKILTEANSIENNLRSLKATDVPKKLKVGMYDSIAVYLYPELISYFKQIYPNSEVELIVHNSLKLAEMVKTNQTDIIIGVNLKNNIGHNTSYYSLFNDFYSIYISPHIEDNKDIPIIFHPETMDENGKPIEKYLTSIYKNRTLHKVYNFETLKTLTKLGVGIGVLPNQVAKPLLNTKELIKIRMSKQLDQFGMHNIGFLASNIFLTKHSDFAKDIYRIGQNWFKK